MKRICSHLQCTNPHYARGLCRSHYDSQRKAGFKDHPRERVDANATFEERLQHHGWRVVDRDWTLVNTPCWEWAAASKRNGYGALRVNIRNDSGLWQEWGAHQVAFVAWVGAIPPGQVVRHKCDNPPCINPNHLELGAMVDNVTDMVHRRRAANGERMTGFKLTDSDVVEIRHVFATKGTSKAELARRYGVSRTLIRRVLNYTIRTAVTNPPLPESDR